MKHNSKSTVMFRWTPIAAVALLAFSVNTARAIDDRIIGTFDTDIAVADGSYAEWPAGSSSKTLEWADQDSEGNSSSGCLKAEVAWTGAIPGWNDTKLVFHDATGSDFAWPGIDCRSYVNLEWDVKVDVANSTLNPNGNYGGMRAVFQGWKDANGNPDGLGWVEVGNVMTIANTNGWQHMKVPLVSYPYNLNKLVLALIADSATNTITYLVDNVKMTAPPQPPPSLSLEKAVPGLALIAASGGQWDRQNIRTIGSSYSWIGRPGPVSYSVDVAKHASVDGFRLHMYLVPGISNPNRADSDWHETNILMVAIYSNPDGATAQINAKYNSPDSNGQLFTPVASGGGDMGGIGANSSVGTWTLTLSQDTNLVVTVPGGSSMTNTIPAAFIDVWRTLPELQFAVGVMPGNANYVGQKAVVNSVRVTGAAGPDINANFLTAPIDTTNTWTIVAASPTYGVQQVPTDAVYWVNWSLPANGFRLQTTPTLSPTAWASAASTSGFNAGNNHYSLFRQADLPSVNSGYFRLIKEGYSKLLLLLPGETAAPGTATGKTGTPTAQQVSIPFGFTVKAVDSEWFPVTGIDNAIRITSTDASMQVNWGLLPLDAVLANGVFTPTADSSSFGTQGTWTIKVEDTADPTKTSYTSAPVVVNP